MCTLKNSRRWKQSPRPLCLTVEEEKGRGENPQLHGFNRLQRWSALAVSPTYQHASIIYRSALYAGTQSDARVSVPGEGWRRVREEHLLAHCLPPRVKKRWGKKPPLHHKLKFQVYFCPLSRIKWIRLPNHRTLWGETLPHLDYASWNGLQKHYILSEQICTKTSVIAFLLFISTTTTFSKCQVRSRPCLLPPPPSVFYTSS